MATTANDSRTLGDAMLEIFRAYGVEHIFSSPGNEWSPLWEALAKAKAQGKGPTYLNIRHEELAVNLAQGYHYQSLKLPLILLHTSVGTLKAAMALRAATQAQVPMVVMAGDSVGFGEMSTPDAGSHWVYAASDVGGAARLARPVVKRASAVTSREVMLGTIRDACRLALTPPMGPVFLGVPLEFVWMDDCPPFDGRCTPPPLPVHADSAALEDVARQLVSAKRPVLVTGSAGRDTRNVAILVELAERLAMPVVETGPDFLNFPRGHQLHQGFNADQLMNEADVVVLVATQLPWYPASRRPGNAKIIQIDDDPSNERLPYWGFQVDVVIPGELNSTLQQLNALVAKLDTASVSVADARKERLAELAGRQEKSREDARSKALALSNNHPMSSLFAAQVIGEELPQNVALVEETITQKGMVLRHVVRNLPGTACRAPGGGLGKGMGLALGLKVADPDRPVALIVGDGSFYYNPVPAAFGFAQQYNAPILVIIMDNRGYGSEKDDIVRLYPDGYSVRTGTFLGSLIEPTPDYAGFAQAFGGYGERVEDPQELRGAIRRALEQVNAGRLALLDLFVQP